MKRWTTIFSILSVYGCATALPIVVLPVTGTVIDKDTGAPLADVAVILQVEVNVPWGGFRCAHLEYAKSMKDGTFSTSGWSGAIGQRQEGYLAYLPRYDLEGVSLAGGVRLSMKRHTGTPVERLKQLDDLVRSLPCFGDPKLEVVRVLGLIVEEEEGLVTTEQERAHYLGYARRRIALEQQRIANVAEMDKQKAEHQR